MSFRTGVHCVPANEKIMHKSPPLVLAILVSCAISTLVTMVFILLILRVSLVLRHISVLKQTLQILTRKNLKWQVQLYNFHVFKIILIYIYLVLFFFFLNQTESYYPNFYLYSDCTQDCLPLLYNLHSDISLPTGKKMD